MTDRISNTEPAAEEVPSHCTLSKKTYNNVNVLCHSVSPAFNTLLRWKVWIYYQKIVVKGGKSTQLSYSSRSMDA